MNVCKVFLLLIETFEFEKINNECFVVPRSFTKKETLIDDFIFEHK